jgi:hypothetical protein
MHAYVFAVFSVVAERIQTTMVAPVLTRISVYDVSKYCRVLSNAMATVWAVSKSARSCRKHTFLALHNNIFARTLSSTT